MCITTLDGAMLYDERTAREYLRAQGFEHWELDELAELLHGEEMAELRDTARSCK